MNLPFVFLATLAIITGTTSGLNQRRLRKQDKNGLPLNGVRRLGDSLNCSLTDDLVQEIAGYDWLLPNISALVLSGALQGKTYQDLAEFVDTFGSRYTGTDTLEKSIDYLVDSLQKNGLENVHTENATVPVWRRGNESLHMIEPREQKLALLGLGSSIGTPPGGITADVIVVESYDELTSKAALVAGKIVVYNQPYYSYGQSVEFRSSGASHAAQYGAVAVLVRSVTPRSIYSPHTGWQYYDTSLSPNLIPAACITVEDAEMFQRLTSKGVTVTVTLTMDAQNYPDGISRNTVAEWQGSSAPEEVVIVSGHVDSWDVGQGAMDDGGGIFISMMVPYVLRELGLRPRRTVRAVLWTAEEPGWYGAEAYSAAHADELDDFNIVLESDEGTFDPTGLTFTGTNDAACIVREILKLASPLNATTLVMPDDGSDTTVFSQLGVPVGSLTVAGDHYYDYHHSDGDTMTVEDSGQLDRCLTFWTLVSYVLADLSQRLPVAGNITSNAV